jgi:hypothetical protein
VMRLVSSSKLIKMLLLGGIATALTAAPAAIDDRHCGIGWQTALAKDGGGKGGGGGNGGGHGNGHGGDHGRGGGQGNAHGQKHAYGHSRGNIPDTATYDSWDEFVGKLGKGHASGRKARDDQTTEAKSRGAPGFKNHGERTRTMVEIAKRLGYGAHVGAHQAKFGTPFENGIASLQAQLAQARAARNQAEVARLEEELAEAIENAKPGKGPNDSWATADLDVNDDGVVDQRDLDALDQQQVRPASSDEPAS